MGRAFVGRLVRPGPLGGNEGRARLSGVTHSVGCAHRPHTEEGQLVSGETPRGDFRLSSNVNPTCLFPDMTTQG